MNMWRGGIFSDHFVSKSRPIVPVKEFWKSSSVDFLDHCSNGLHEYSVILHFVGWHWAAFRTQSDQRNLEINCSLLVSADKTT